MDTLTIASILTWPVVTTTADQSASSALDVMRAQRISALVVVEGDRPVGIFTERDAVLFASRHRNPESVVVGDVMSRSLVTATADTEYREAYRLISDRGVRHLIVVDKEGRLAGIVSEGNFLDHLGYEYLVRFKEVGAVMTRSVFTLPEAAMAEEAVQLMASRRVSCVIVERRHRPVGMITERDVVRLARNCVDTAATPVVHVMNSPVHTVSANDPLDVTIQRMNESAIRRLVVVDDEGRIAGLVTRHDLTKVLYSRHIEHLRETIANLREELAREPDRLFRHLVDHSADAVVMADAADGAIVDANSHACHYLGYARNELLAMRVPDVSRSFETTSWDQRVEEVRRHGRLLVQTEMRCRDGRTLLTEVNLSYVAGKPNSYIIGILRDISERRRAQQALAESEARLRTLVEAIPDSVQFKDGEGRWLVANSVCLRTFGLEGLKWQGLSDAQIIAQYPKLARLLSNCMASDEAVWAHGDTYRTEEAMVDERGRKTAYWDIIKVPLFTEDGGRRALIVVSRDVTQYRKAEEGLRLAASVFKSAREGIAITDANANVLDVNDAFCRITGYGREEVLGRNPRLLKSGLHDEAFYAAMWRAIQAHGYWSGEIWNRRKDGHVYSELLTVTAVRDAGGEVTKYAGIFTDITVLKEHEKELEHVAHYDALTGIPNRVLLADRMTQAIALTKRSGKSMVIGYLDLDGFKPVNDRFGHEVGDHVLVEVARRLKSAVRDMDTVARLGGDEFVFILLDVEESDVWEATLTRILQAIAAPMSLDGHSVSLSASIGITLYPRDDGDPDTLLRHADQAMYRAKEEGKSRYRVFEMPNSR